jgi:hypothetical protein
MTQDVHSALRQVENLEVSEEQSKLHYMTLQDCYNEDKMQCLGLMLSNNLAQQLAPSNIACDLPLIP